jgi:small subunit ribosomal protein S6e
MDYKVVVSDPESGKSYQREVKDEKAKRLTGLKVGSEFDGSVLGLADYKLTVTGGSDRSGFPMRKGIHGAARHMVLSKGGVGYRPQGEQRIRKRMRGEVIEEDIMQINTKIVKKGKTSIEEAFGIKPEEKKVEPAAVEAKKE